MSPTVGCLGDPELLASAVGEPVSESLRAHLGECPACRARLEALRAELAALRRAGAGTPPLEEIVTATGPEVPSFEGARACLGTDSAATTTQEEPPPVSTEPR